ncbi:glycerate kinase [Microplitis mediator]|uniref:glycerate kinase n=1 Tax=Microplitis mediator TaxID=375433 RepID=UPI002556FBC5|nr:glycerate kinase [Microplitis mediator]
MLKSLNKQFLSTKIMSQKPKCLHQIKENLKEIYYAALESVKPNKIIDNKIKVNDNNLLIDNEIIAITDKVYIVGFGKAVMGMAIALEKLLGNRLIKGIVSIPRGSKNTIKSEIQPKLTGLINYEENSINNEPDDDTLSVTRSIIEMIQSLNENDTLIVLVSGGGSALLSMPKPPVILEEKLNICRKLFNSGADIKEVNLIRQKLSMVKAGGLAFMAYPAFVIGLILSDIIDNPIELIASGPTVYNLIPPENIEKILIKYNLLNQLSINLKHVLLSKESYQLNLEQYNQNYNNRVKNIIIGNNSLAIENAKLECLRKGFNSIILLNNIQGLVTSISKTYTKLCSLVCKTLIKSISFEEFNEVMYNDPDLLLLNNKANEIYQAVKVMEDKGLILIAGGEPSVLVTGSGKGGRNQELALRFSQDWFKTITNSPELNSFDVIFLSVSTDGQDGPTDATGAFGYAEINSTLIKLQELVNNKLKNEIKDEKIKDLIIEELQNIDINNVLQNNDSYNFYSRFLKGSNLVKTGLTGTNVMDLHFFYIRRKSLNYSINDEFVVSLNEHDFFLNSLQ